MSNTENQADTQSISKKLRQKWVFITAGLIILCSILWVLWIIFGPVKVIKTDDARVDVDYSTIASKVNGNVSQILVKENQQVSKGQLLVVIDDRDLKAALAEAASKYAQAQADLSEAEKNVERQPSMIQESEARVKKLKASIQFTKENTERYEMLQAEGAESKRISQQSRTTLLEQGADLDVAKLQTKDAQYQHELYKIQVKAKEAALKQAEAAREKAKLNLSYTQIYAPIDGVIGQKSGNEGNFVSAGNPLMVVVPLNDIYIQANFREIELKHIQLGQPVEIHVDAYDIDLKGVVESLAPSTGAFFSPISSSNATGNFTKIVQRLPLRIKVLENQPESKLLRPGLSVVVSVDTNVENTMIQNK